MASGNNYYTHTEATRVNLFHLPNNNGNNHYTYKISILKCKSYHTSKQISSSTILFVNLSNFLCSECLRHQVSH